MSVTVSAVLAEKRDRLLVTGAVTVLHLTTGDRGRLRAKVRGDTRSYRVWRDGDEGLMCSCKAAEYGLLCAHAMAVALVTDGPWKES